MLPWLLLDTKNCQNSIKSFFFAQRAKKALVEGRSPPQELELGPRSGPYLLVNVKVKCSGVGTSMGQKLNQKKLKIFEVQVRARNLKF